MRKLACTGCGAPLEWDGVAPVVTCGACGSRFQMNVGRPAQDTWRAEALRGGCVANRPCMGPVIKGVPFDETGRVYYRSWLPEGWTYRIAEPDNRFYGATLATPFPAVIILKSPDERSCMEHITSNTFQDPGIVQPPQAFGGGFGGFLQNLGSAMGGLQYGNGELGMDGMVHNPNNLYNVTGLTRIRPFASAADCCDDLVRRETATMGLTNISVVAEDNHDNFASERVETLLAQAPDQVRATYWYEWHRRTYGCLKNGEQYALVAEVQVSSNGFNAGRGPAAQAPQASPQPSGFLGRMAAAMGGAAQGMAAAQMPRVWSTDYEILVITPAAEFGTVADEYERFRTSVELGPDLEQTCDWLRTWLQSQAMQTQNTINGAMAQMAADRSASWDRRQAIINDTNAYTSGVMHDMMASNAASHERVAGMQSEMIREVNTYAGYGGPVEASTRWDHVYQGAPGSYPGQDTYVGVEGDWLEPGVNFVELPKI